MRKGIIVLFASLSLGLLAYYSYQNLLYLIPLSMLSLLIFLEGFYVLRKSNAKHDESDHLRNDVGAYIINLDRSYGRYQHILPQVSELGLEVNRVVGVDGNTLSDDEFNQKADLKSYHKLLGHYPKRGTIGCSLSHITAWEMFVVSEFKYAIIFEDDVSFDPKILRETIKALENNSELWDVVTFEVSHKGMPLNISKLNNIDKNLVVYLTEISHAGAYILNRKTALKLLEKALPVKMPIDHFMTRGWEFGIKFMGVEPRIVRQTYGFSEIHQTTYIKSKNWDLVSILRLLNKGVYKFKSYIIRFVYNLRIYLLRKSA